MTDRQWRQLVVILGVVLVGLVAFTVFVGLPRGPAVSPSPPIGQGSPTPSTPGPTPGPTDESPSPSGSPSESPSVEPSESPSATPQPARPSISVSGGVPVTTLRIVDLGLDDPASSGALKRQFGFKSDGRGKVTVEILASKGGRTTLCFQEEKEAATCLTLAKGKFTGTPTATATTWTVTVIGARGVRPRVTLLISFPVRNPLVTISNVRFRGGDATGLRGLTAEVLARANGPLRLKGTLTAGGSASRQTSVYSLTDLDPATTARFGRRQRASDVVISRNVAGPALYRVILENAAARGAATVLLGGSLRWP